MIRITTAEEISRDSWAVRRGQRIWISGTNAKHGNRIIGNKDPVAQFHFVIDKIEGALKSLGGKLADVISTRTYLRNMEDWKDLAPIHAERFSQSNTANTLLEGGHLLDQYLLEMEAEAILE